jgi:hypothetical protein
MPIHFVHRYLLQQLGVFDEKPLINIETHAVSFDSTSQNEDIVSTFIEYQPIGIGNDWCKLMCGCRKIMLIEIRIVLEEEMLIKAEGKRSGLLDIRMVWE